MCVCVPARMFSFILICGLFRSVILSQTPANQQVAHIFYINSFCIELAIHRNWCVSTIFNTVDMYVCTLHAAQHRIAIQQTHTTSIHWSIKTCDWFSLNVSFCSVYIFSFSFQFISFLFGFNVALFIFERVPVAVSNIDQMYISDLFMRIQSTYIA